MERGGVKEGPVPRNMMEGISLAERQMDGLRKSVFGLDGFIPSSDVSWEDAVV